MGSVMTTSLYWMSSIKLVSLMMRPKKEREELSLLSFAKHFLWFAFPINERKEPPRPALDLALYVGYHGALAAVKIVVSSWLHAWMLRFGLITLRDAII